ncbi:MAG: hypothetical protein A2328_06970, partial [Bdellovibrionales bacterium RIFOXYB2_FULL_36_6]
MTDMIKNVTETQTIPAITIFTEESPFEKWLRERPKWLQTAATPLIEAGLLPDQDEINLLADLCIKEAMNQPDPSFKTIPQGTYTQQPVGSELKIQKLKNVTGVNAIQTNAELCFGDTNISVIYGNNGSGKSGFVRLLKHACGTRVKSDLLPDVFSDTVINPTAEIEIKDNGITKELNWSQSNTSLSQLRHAHIFDALTASAYINEKNEAAYEPRTMRIISALINICDQVAKVLTRNKGKLVKTLPNIPVEYTNTSSSNFLSSLKANTSQKSVNQACNFTKEEEDERLSLEISLKRTDIQGRLKEINQQKTRLIQIKSELQTLKDGYANTQLSNISAVRIDAFMKRKVATEDATKVFNNAPLTGIGQDSWRLLWNQARSYSEQLAYPSLSFPVIENQARCVLCHQILDDDSKTRLRNFEAFVKGELESQAQAAEIKLSSLIDSLPVLPKKEDWNIKFDNLKIDSTLPEQIYDSLILLQTAIKQATAFDQLEPVTWIPLDNALKSIENTLLAELKILNDLQESEKREVLEKRFKELKAKEWLSQHKASIELEIQRLNQIKILELAEKTTKTTALTNKKSELAKEELSQGYKDRFTNELAALGGNRIPVQLKETPAVKGKIGFQLVLKDAKQKAQANVVLSEGETRIVALAAFIADITGSHQATPFIFDDPISSLDEDFEECVVRRLIEFSKTRQVIIFTHRVSLVTLLYEASERLKNRAEGMNIKQPEITIYVGAIRRF